MKPAIKKKKPGTKKKPVKKVKRKRRSGKLVLQDKITAVLIAAFFVLVAFASSLVIVFLHNRQSETVDFPLEIPVELTLEDPDTIDIPQEKPAAVQDQRPVTQTPLVEKPQAPPAESPLPNQASQPAKQEIPKEAPVKVTSAPERAPVAAAPERPPARGRLAFVIDDAGNNLKELDPFLRFPGPLTIAVLPGLPNSAEAARRIRAAGKEVFLHQPMESLGGHNPGPGAIYSKMEETEIRFIINKNLDELWPVTGMNNHEGSRITMDPKTMEIILNICQERGIIFLDSRTTADTAAPAVAQRLGILIGERDVFLDNEQDKASISRYMNMGLQRAEQRGSAVMIGHTWSPELAPLLEEQYPSWINQGYSLITVSGISRNSR